MTGSPARLRTRRRARPAGRLLATAMASLAFASLVGCGGGGSGGLLRGVPGASGSGPAVPPGVSTNVVVNPDSIAVINVSSPEVALLGAGGNTTSTITVQVNNQLGDPLADVCVEFTLENGGLGGGESVNPGPQTAASCGSVTDGFGQVSTTFRGGTQAGTVNVIAYIDADDDNLVDGSEIKTTITVSVNSGPPFGNHFALVSQFPNGPFALAAGATLVRFGEINGVTAYLSDRFTNPVPEGTVVTFRTFDPLGLTPAITIDGSGQTTAQVSEVGVDSRTAAPGPSDGLVDALGFTQGGADASVLSLARTANGNLYAGTDGGGNFRSTNNGGTWTLVGEPDTGLFDGYISDLVVNPFNQNELFAATNRGIYFSPTGVNWFRRDGTVPIVNEVPTPIGGFPTTTFDLTFEPLSQARIDARVQGTPNRFFSLVRPSPMAPRLRLVFDQSVPNPGDLVVTYDQLNFLPFLPITSIAPDTNTANRYYVGLLGGGVYRTDDAGMTWFEVNADLSNNNVQDLAYDQENDDLYAATEGGGVYRNPNPSNSSSQWVQLFGTGANTLRDLNVTAIAVDPLINGATLLAAGSKTGGVQVSTDLGVNWLTPTGAPFTGTLPPDAEVSRIQVTDGTTIYALTVDDEDPTVTTGNLWRSLNSGGTFGTLGAGQFTSRFNYGLLVNGTEVLVGGRGRSVNRSVDSGATFADVTGLAPNRIGNSLFAGTSFVLGGETNINFRVDPNLGCPTGTFGPGDCRDIRFLITEAGNQRPLPAGSTISISLQTENGDPNAQISQEINTTLPNALTGAPGLTDFEVRLFNAGVSIPEVANVVVAVTSPNGNENLTLTFAMTP